MTLEDNKDTDSLAAIRTKIAEIGVRNSRVMLTPVVGLTPLWGQTSRGDEEAVIVPNVASVGCQTHSIVCCLWDCI